jgi:hypothetical protein
MTDPLDTLPESVPIQRWHATGDYVSPAEYRDDGEFVDYDEHCAEVNRLTARVQELERENGELRKCNLNLGAELIQRMEGMGWRDRADRAEAELAAIRRRIAVAGRAACREDGGLVGPSLIAYMAQEDVGKTFALLPLDDEEPKQ